LYEQVVKLNEGEVSEPVAAQDGVHIVQMAKNTRFNLGVEVAQVLVVLSAVLLAAIPVKVKLAIPRPIFTEIAASFLGAEGRVWFPSRTIVFS
jgi:hypothetical protein